MGPEGSLDFCFCSGSEGVVSLLLVIAVFFWGEGSEFGWRRGDGS